MTNPTRYGTSCAPREDGVFVHFSEYEKVVGECADWKRRWQDAVDHASEAIVERNHWQSNHDNQVSRARFLIERGDIPFERVRAYEEMEALREDKARLDWLDCMNAQLNKFYGTTYQWKAILSPNIVRLTAGRQWAGYVGDIDLNDAQCGEGSFESCRKAIDDARGGK